MPFQPNYAVPQDRLPYFLTGGPVGVLVCHGFMGSPKSSRPLAEYLAARDVTVACPLLPGHGHYPDKLYKIPWQSWLAEVEEAFQSLRQSCQEIILIGHSMGAVLAAQLALHHKSVAGLVFLAPPYDVPDRRIRWMRYLRYVMPWFYPLSSRRLKHIVRQRVLDFDPTLDYDSPEVQAQLPQLTRIPTSGLDEMRKMGDVGRDLWPRLDLPTLILQGGHDDAVSPGSAERIHTLLPHPEKKLVVFEDGGHELLRPFDPTHQAVWQRIYMFVQEVVSQPLTAMP